MNKNIKRIIALTLTISMYGAISAMMPGTYLDITSKIVYAASYSADDGELNSLSVKSIGGETLDLRDGYNGSNVKLSEDKEYYVKLTDDSDGIKITSKVEGTDYIVKIFTSDNLDAIAYDPGDKILLGKGDSTIYIRTYKSESAFRKAKNSQHDISVCEEEYKINVRKTTESSYEDTTQDSIYLDKLDLSKGDISFIKEKTTYDIKVDSDVEHINITAKPESSSDRVRINGKLANSDDKYKETVDLDEGKNEIKIKVTDDKDNQRTYTLNIQRGDSSSSNQDRVYLESLTLSDGNIDFSAENTTYDVDIDESISKVTIGAKPEDEGYLVTIAGAQVNSGNDYEKKISLKKGKNTVNVEVQDELNNKKRTYTVTINRGKAEETNTNTDTSTKTDTDKSTIPKTGWIETEAGWKYNDEKGNTVKNSWLLDKETGLYCYLNEDGFRKTGWFKDKDKWYMLNDKGAMLTGWYKAEATSGSSTSTLNANTVNWYYLNTDGSMKTGWLSDGGKWYYLNSDGTMQKGWLILSNSKYYLNDDGTMAVGTKTIADKVYKFNNNGTLV
jgi:glucan-binding YG repeat protein